MRIIFKRKKAFPLFYAKVPVFLDGEKVADIKNGEEFEYNGAKPEKIKLRGPGVIRDAKFEFPHDADEVIIEFKIAMGFLAGGFSVTIKIGDKVVDHFVKTL